MRIRTKPLRTRACGWIAALGAASLLATDASALTVSRLTPPSELFATSGASATPMISRFIPYQRFDLAATIRPDAAQTITGATFLVDGVAVPGTVTLVPATVAGLPANTVVAILRAYSNATAGVHTLTVQAVQSDAATVSANGNFEVVPISNLGRKTKNIVIMLGDGMGSGHRAAARIMQNGIAEGKARTRMQMDTFPVVANITTSSLNSIITDSAPGMQNYVTGNKSANNQEGVWPDDTTAAFDNPRFEYMSEYLARTQGKKLGVVTTADVFDATPASMAIHTQARGNGTGIVDQFFDDRGQTGLTVLMGGGRKWFLPNPTNCPATGCGTATGFNGSARVNNFDYVLPADLVAGWGSALGALDPGRDLINDFQGAGWFYAATENDMAVAPNNQPLLGLFALSNMNIALDKINGRRNPPPTVVDDYGFPDQPLLEEMTTKALAVLDAQSPNGFVLMVEGASIDKQAHNMDTERFVLDTIEFDRAIGVAKQYAATHPDTLVIVTADHECAGVAVIGGSLVTDAALQARITAGGVANVRNGVVGTYDAAAFPRYTLAADGYPVTTDIDFRMLIGYAANADRFEDWRTNPQPLRDSQQPGNGVAPLSTYPALPVNRDVVGNFSVTGQIADTIAAHTANDIPLSAYGRGSSLIGGTMDNTDVFFSMMQAAIGGAK